MQAETYGEQWDPWCALRETHSGVVVLLGDRAYKLKKPVDLGFLDFRDQEDRRRVCAQEVELNRRTAPDVYLGVGELTVPGAPAEPVIVMRRLPERFRLTTLIRDGHPVDDEVRRIARRVAAFHAGASSGPDVIRHGTLAALRQRWHDNLTQARATAAPALDPEALDEIELLVGRFLDGRADLFDDRIRRGAIVDGHGDLTTDDVFCLPDGPRLLDCLEFDDALRHVDRLDDIAFLAMGLEELGAAEAARILVDTWAEGVGDPAPSSLVHHFIAYRAFVRAKVGCLRGAELHGPGAEAVRRYVDMTLAHLRAGAVTLVLVGGPPATGKSTLAAAVADRLGMTVLSSDRTRKELAGLDPRSSAAAGFGQGIYTPAGTRATYAVLLDHADRLLRRGESVVLDASWTSAEDRAAASALATAATADLVELRCDVDEVTARQRLRTRESLSDADEDVASRLRHSAAPWPSSHRIDTDRSLQECLEDACALVRPASSPTAVG